MPAKRSEKRKQKRIDGYHSRSKAKQNKMYAIRQRNYDICNQAKLTDPDDLQITLVKSPIGAIPKHKKTVKALGFSYTQQSLRRKNTPIIAGMCRSIVHLVRVELLIGENQA